MANALDVTLQELDTTLSADGSGSSVDIESRDCLRLDVDVVVVNGTVQVIIETSADDSNWRTAVETEELDASQRLSLVAGDLSRYLRARWVIASGSSKLSILGTATRLYCVPADITRFGVPAAALEEISEADKLDACFAATDEADSYIGAAFSLPLTRWGEDIRKNATKLAILQVFEKRGYDPEEDNWIPEGEKRAVAWFTKLAKGHVKPSGVIDQTPTRVDSGTVVGRRSPRREAFRVM